MKLPATTRERLVELQQRLLNEGKPALPTSFGLHELVGRAIIWREKGGPGGGKVGHVGNGSQAAIDREQLLGLLLLAVEEPSSARQLISGTVQGEVAP